MSNKWLELARKNGIKDKTYYSRLEYGWTKEKAATTPVKRRMDNEWLKIAQQNGIHSSTFYKRVDDMFWSPEEAATTPPMSKQDALKFAHEQLAIYREINNKRLFENEKNLFKVTPQHLEIARKNGICKSTVKTRVYEKGWTVQEAIKVPIQKGFEKPEGYSEYLELALQNGISQSMFRDRVKAGWDLKEAATRPRVDPKERRRADKKWIDLAIKNGLEYHVYWKRVKAGWTPEEAAMTPLLKKGKEYLNDQRRENSLKAFKEFKKG